MVNHCTVKEKIQVRGVQTMDNLALGVLLAIRNFDNSLTHLAFQSGIPYSFTFSNASF